MSQQVSNLYAARVFSEHPIALWPMDDDFSFISRIPVEEKDILNWNFNNLQQLSPFTEPLNIPIEEADTSGVTIVSASVGLYATASAGAINTTLELDPNKKTISINAFVYDYQGFVNNYQIGFLVSGSTFVTAHDGQGLEVWQKISHTMDVPSGDVDIHPYIRINYDDPGPDSGEEFDVAINGISVGQWSEQFHYSGTGIFPTSITDSTLLDILSASSSLSSSAIKSVEVDAYGISNTQNGHYIVEGNRMLATNNYFPITFGATNITTLKHPLSGDIPSIVFPGYGFLNESGKYEQLTAEFWLRAYTTSTNPTRIFGPISSEDGVYIDKNFITIKIGQYRQSYFVGKWYRPMLIHFRYDVNLASLLINGDLVMELPLNQDRITLADSDKDYLGFYCKENIYPLEVDTFGIYPYIVQEQIAKKRYIYAQGVESADNIASNFKGDSFNVDFSFANYTTTLNYPDMNDWNSGFFNNARSTSSYLTLPELTAPEIIFSEEIDIEDFLDDNFAIQSTASHAFIRLKPNEEYSDIDGSIYFQNLNVLDSPVKSVIAVYESPSVLPEEEETVLFFTNNINNNRFYTTISDGGVKYYFNSTLLFTHALSASQIFTVGFDIDQVSSSFSSTIGNFFSNPQNLSLRVGGCPLTTCTGKIFDIHFNNRLFTDKDVSEYLLDNGIVDPDLGPENFFNYIANYSWHPQRLSDSLRLTVGSKGYWEDSIPLSYFGKPVKDISGNTYYDLDLIQFNIDAPSQITLTEEGEETEPHEETVKAYITIQNSDDVGTIPYTNYTNTSLIGSSRVLDFDSVSNYQTTKYEVTDRTIIFPPKEQVDFEDYYLTIHIEIQTNGISTNPVRIRKMSLASLAYDETNFYSINSPNGYKLYPFTRYGQTYAFKEKNPFAIYKNSTSYMYMTGDSGINILPKSTTGTRGITIPINQQLSDEYLLGGIQVWTMYNKKTTIDETIQMGSVYTPTTGYDAWIIPEPNNLRGKFVLYNKGTTTEASGIIFYQNGNIVDHPYITPLQWSSISIAFDQSIVLNNSVAQFEIYEGFMVNNIAFYKKSSDILGSTVVDKTWQELRSESTWGTWYNFSSTWDFVKDKIVATTFTVDGNAIYNSTFGISSTVSSDDTVLSITSDGITIVSDSIWNEYSAKPV